MRVHPRSMKRDKVCRSASRSWKEHWRKKESHQRAIDDEFELMERSYQLASKYMPRQQEPEETSSPPTAGQGKSRLPSPFRSTEQCRLPLSGEIDNDEIYRMYSQPRNLGFLTAAKRKRHDR